MTDSKSTTDSASMTELKSTASATEASARESSDKRQLDFGHPNWRFRGTGIGARRGID
jgi:hypothetical protein